MVPLIMSPEMILRFQSCVNMMEKKIITIVDNSTYLAVNEGVMKNGVDDINIKLNDIYHVSYYRKN